jgi:hypothetical protein
LVIDQRPDPYIEATATGMPAAAAAVLITLIKLAQLVRHNRAAT